MLAGFQGPRAVATGVRCWLTTDIPEKYFLAGRLPAAFRRPSLVLTGNTSDGRRLLLRQGYREGDR